MVRAQAVAWAGPPKATQKLNAMVATAHLTGKASQGGPAVQ